MFDGFFYIVLLERVLTLNTTINDFKSHCSILQTGFVKRNASSKYEEVGLLGARAKQEEYDDLGERTGHKVLRTIVQKASTDRVKFWTNSAAEAVQEEKGWLLNKEQLRGLFKKSKTFEKNGGGVFTGDEEFEDGGAESGNEEFEDGGEEEDEFEDNGQGEGEFEDGGDGEDESGSVYVASSPPSDDSEADEFVLQDNKSKRRNPAPKKAAPKRAARPIGPLEKS
jgi:hypothetical protein